jgi:hypothetical protein
VAQSPARPPPVTSTMWPFGSLQKLMKVLARLFSQDRHSDHDGIRNLITVVSDINLVVISTISLFIHYHRLQVTDTKEATSYDPNHAVFVVSPPLANDRLSGYAR